MVENGVVAVVVGGVLNQAQVHSNSTNSLEFQILSTFHRFQEINLAIVFASHGL